MSNQLNGRGNYDDCASHTTLVQMPIDIMYGNPSLLLSSVPEYVSDLRSRLQAAYRIVRERMNRKLQRQKY